MCGIVGYVGSKNCSSILLDALRKLEYRGYDSAGLAIYDGGAIQITRAVGKLENLARALVNRDLLGCTGIGHTRWATHGRPSEPNAHPHQVGAVAVVHNGIIENHLELKRLLQSQGAVFQSDTDTEIIAHLIDRARPHHKTLVSAVRSALSEVRGAYALAVVSNSDPGRVVLAKNASPLVIGLAENETLCASDIPALLGHTRTMIFLEDGDIAEMTADGARIENMNGEPVSRPAKTIDWSPVQAEKGGYKHFMLKEIFEQPRAIEDTLRGRINLDEGDLVPEELGLSPDAASKITRVVFVACGTSFHASLVGRYWVEQLAKLPCVAELGSEVRYREPVFGPGDLVVAVSQSGETADTLAALAAAKSQGSQLLALVNVVDSAIARSAGAALYTHAGPEIGVASTKCFTTQLAALLMLAIYLGKRRGALTRESARTLLQALLEVPNDMRRALEREEQAIAVARAWQHTQHMLFLGRGLGFPIALEGALKLKEISYAHAEGYAAGEMKHGPIALIDSNMPVVMVMPRDRYYEKTLSNLQEVKARDAQVIAVVTEGDEGTASLAEHVLEVPNSPELVLPLLTVLPLQLVAYHFADLKGTDVDQPRNLAKVVTVE